MAESPYKAGREITARCYVALRNKDRGELADERHEQTVSRFWGHALRLRTTTPSMQCGIGPSASISDRQYPPHNVQLTFHLFSLLCLPCSRLLLCTQRRRNYKDIHRLRTVEPTRSFILLSLFSKPCNRQTGAVNFLPPHSDIHTLILGTYACS